jgi:predicted dehydrogenase
VKKLRVGVVGLGGIAQKAWLPVLGAATDWTLQGSGKLHEATVFTVTHRIYRNA